MLHWFVIASIKKQKQAKNHKLGSLKNKKKATDSHTEAHYLHDKVLFSLGAPSHSSPTPHGLPPTSCGSINHHIVAQFVRLPLEIPASHCCSVDPACLWGTWQGSGRQPMHLGPCHPHGRSGRSCWVLPSAWPTSEVIWGLNQQVWHLCLLFSIISFFK